MSEILIENLTKRYGAVEVIEGMNLSIPKGRLTVLLGPSGCGKSTLLRMIAGLEDVSDGTILIANEPVNDVDPSERGCAMVFQNYALYPHQTVRKNLAFPLKMSGVSKDKIAERVDEISKLLQIDMLLERLPRDLSGGQRQRVAIGRAMIRNPDVFLFDEPLSNLDAELRVKMRLEISRLQSTLDATMVFVTHDQVEAMTLAHQIVIMRAGVIEQTGTPLEVYDAPKTQFVAGFLGSPSMNFIAIDAAAKITAGDVFTLSDDLSLSLGCDLPPGTTTIGIRPQSIKAAYGDTEQTSSTKEASALTLQSFDDLGTEHLGDRAFRYIRSGTAELAFLEEDPHKVMDATRLELRFANSDVHFFDANGQVIGVSH